MHFCSHLSQSVCVQFKKKNKDKSPSYSNFHTDWFTVMMKPVYPIPKLVKVIIPYPVSGKVGMLLFVMTGQDSTVAAR